MSGIRALIRVRVNPYSAVVSPSEPLRQVPAMKATVDTWIESDPKTDEWREEAEKRSYSESALSGMNPGAQTTASLAK